MVKGSTCPGVKPMSISGRFNSERERLVSMSDEERAFRKQWLQDQILAPNEPRKVPELYTASYNPIRRFYRWPLEQLKTALEPVVGEQRAFKIRFFTGKILMGIAGAYAITYYLKYNGNNWTRSAGWSLIKSREAVLEGDAGYPKLSERSKPDDYATRGFENFKLNL